MAMKCKSDLDHCDAISTRAAAETATFGVTRVENGSCRNDSTYNGPLFVLTRNGKLGMQLKPDLARVLPERLLQAAETGNVRIQHKRLRVWWPYATLSREAAQGLAADLAAAVLG